MLARITFNHFARPTFNLPAGTADKSNVAASGNVGASPDAATSNADASSQDNSVAQQFTDYAKMTPMQRMRANILKSMGLTEDELEAMPPEQRRAVEQTIAQSIKEKLKNTSEPGQVVDVSA